jgi:hypothetical protein
MRAYKLISQFILVSFTLFIASIASAQTSATPNIVMAPTGAAQTCETPAGAQIAECYNFVPGNAPFVLLIKATNNQTTNYSYTVVATMGDGSTKVVTGQVGRSDDNSGYTAASVNLGCDAVSVSTTVNEANS